MTGEKVCPKCHELVVESEPGGDSRCVNGHEFPTYLVLSLIEEDGPDGDKFVKDMLSVSVYWFSKLFIEVHGRGPRSPEELDPYMRALFRRMDQEFPDVDGTVSGEDWVRIIADELRQYGPEGQVVHQEITDQMEKIQEKLKHGLL